MISKAVMTEELNMAIKILVKWQQRFEEGLPGVDMPAPDDHVTECFSEMTSEFQLVAGKLDSLAGLISQG